MTLARLVTYGLIWLFIATVTALYVGAHISLLIRPANPSGAGPARRAEVAPHSHARRASLRLVDER